MNKYISWIPEAFKARFPEAELQKGIDLNEDHLLTENEKIRDTNHNGVIGDAGDWEDFVRWNQPEVAALGGIFKWVSVFDAGNPLHDVLWIESELEPLEKTDAAYAFVEEVLDEVRKGEPDLRSPEDKLSLVDIAIWHSKKIKMENQGNPLLTENIQNKAFDCDTSSDVGLAVAYEMAWPVSLVYAPEHVFVRWQDSSIRFNIDAGEIETDKGYIKERNISPLSVKQGVYLAQLNPDQIRSLFFENRAQAKKHLGEYSASMLDHDQAILLDPSNVIALHNRGNARITSKNYEGALEDYKKVIKLDPNDKNAPEIIALLSAPPKTQNIKANDK